jgi:uroporphyrin-III C-methyltransferase
LAAQSSATVVVLMGMSKLNEIVSIFKMNPKEKPRCDYSKRNHPKRNRNGNDKPIEQVVLNKIKFSCIIVIGEVVR